MNQLRLAPLLLLSATLSVAFCFPLAIPNDDESIRAPKNVLVGVSLDMVEQATDGESSMSGPRPGARTREIFDKCWV
jgi:hypothetical protein